jgi:hypothetical protein
LEFAFHPHEGLQQSQYRLAQPFVPEICGLVLPGVGTPPPPPAPDTPPEPAAPPRADEPAEPEPPPAPGLLPQRPQVKLQKLPLKM